MHEDDVQVKRRENEEQATASRARILGLPYLDTRQFEETIPLVVRIKNEELQDSTNLVIFTLDYTRPRKWYLSWLDKWRNYQYDRTVDIDRDEPDDCDENYCYYVIWIKRNNAQTLKSIEYRIE